jgi:hypothetical protein
MLTDSRLRPHLVKILGLLFVVVALLANQVEAYGWGKRVPRSQFHFTSLPLPEPAGLARSVRAIRPNLQRIGAWFSAVGAAVAVGDLDGDGLANDLCHVDPRWDKVLVSPAPGTGARFPLFSLEPPVKLFDPLRMAPTGCVLGDLNSDGLLDATISYWERTPLVFLQRATGGQLGVDRFAVEDIVPTGQRWATTTATLTDIDGDGRLDIVVGNYFPDGSDILDVAPSGPDKAMSMHDSFSNAFNGGRDRILRQTGSAPSPAPTVTFEDVPALSEDVARAWTLAIGAADLDGDLLPELYFANDFGPDRLLRNRSTPGHIQLDLVEGRLDFTTPPSKVLGHDSFKGMGVDFSDVNGDGKLDIFVDNITSNFAFHESNFLFLSNGQRDDLGAYRDASRPLGVAQSGWSWDARFGDFDNDTYAEIMVATGFVQGRTNRWPEAMELAFANDRVVHDTQWWPSFREDADISGHEPNRFFVRGSGERYIDMAAEAGLASTAVSRGVATADVDGDGDLDVVIANQWEPSVLYRNDCVRCGQSLVLGLYHRRIGAAAGEPGRSPAIGVTAVVTLPDGRRLVDQVDGGWGHSGKRSPELHFGLGEVAAGIPMSVALSWRDLNGVLHTHTVLLTPGRHDLTLDDLTADASLGG